MGSKWETQDKSADDEEELHSTLTVGNNVPEPAATRLMQGDLYGNVETYDAENSNKAQSVYLRDVIARGRNPSQRGEKLALLRTDECCFSQV